MTPATQVLLSGLLTYGVPLAFAVRELVLLRRKPNDDGGRPDDRRPAPVPPGPIAGSTPQRPLPACLIPPPRPNQAQASRPLELA